MSEASTRYAYARGRAMNEPFGRNEGQKTVTKGIDSRQTPKAHVKGISFGPVRGL